MTIDFYTNNSENYRLSKSLSSVTSMSGSLKNESSLVNPTILVEGDISTIRKANYCIISEFGRKYFINNYKSIRNNLFEITCHCDVLSTYADEIKKCKAIVSRQENNWNLYLNDGSFKAYQNPIVQTKLFPTGFNSFAYILAIAGK